METYLKGFKQAINEENGYGIAAAIHPIPTSEDPNRLYNFYNSSNASSIQADIRYAIVYSSDVRLSKAEGAAWLDVFVAFWKFAGELLGAEQAVNEGNQKAADWSKVNAAWMGVTTALIRGYSNFGFPAWSIPCLYVAGKYLRHFAIKADEHIAGSKSNVTFNEGFQDDVVGAAGKNANLEEAARQINRIFYLCSSDRAPIEDSRKWGLYYIANLLFKTYFKLNSVSLSKNVLASIRATKGDMPPFEALPKSHRVTYKYYVGVLFFLEEDYVQAEENLTEAWRLCHKDATRNIELILTYLIPCHLLTTHTLPSASLLAPYPRLQRLFSPLSACIRRGDLAGFDAALVAGEAEFVKRRIYLTLERGRDIALRNLLRKVYIAGGFEPLKEGQAETDRIRRTRVPLAEFDAAIRLGMGQRDGEWLERDEVECLIANMIYKNLMKGYISREHGMVVLSKSGPAFPGTRV